MSATCVPWDVPRGTAGLVQNTATPVFPHFWAPERGDTGLCWDRGRGGAAPSPPFRVRHVTPSHCPRGCRAGPPHHRAQDGRTGGAAVWVPAARLEGRRGGL